MDTYTITIRSTKLHTSFAVESVSHKEAWQEVFNFLDSHFLELGEVPVHVTVQRIAETVIAP